MPVTRTAANTFSNRTIHHGTRSGFSGPHINSAGVSTAYQEISIAVRAQQLAQQRSKQYFYTESAPEVVSLDWYPYPPDFADAPEPINLGPAFAMLEFTPAPVVIPDWGYVAQSADPDFSDLLLPTETYFDMPYKVPKEDTLVSQFYIVHPDPVPPDELIAPPELARPPPPEVLFLAQDFNVQHPIAPPPDELPPTESVIPSTDALIRDLGWFLQPPTEPPPDELPWTEFTLPSTDALVRDIGWLVQHPDPPIDPASPVTDIAYTERDMVVEVFDLDWLVFHPEPVPPDELPPTEYVLPSTDALTRDIGWYVQHPAPPIDPELPPTEFVIPSTDALIRNIAWFQQHPEPIEPEPQPWVDYEPTQIDLQAAPPDFDWYVQHPGPVPPDDLPWTEYVIPSISAIVRSIAWLVQHPVAPPEAELPPTEYVIPSPDARVRDISWIPQSPTAPPPDELPPTEYVLPSTDALTRAIAWLVQHPDPPIDTAQASVGAFALPDRLPDLRIGWDIQEPEPPIDTAQAPIGAFVLPERVPDLAIGWEPQSPTAPPPPELPLTEYAAPARIPDLKHGWDIEDPLPPPETPPEYTQTGLIEFTQPPAAPSFDWHVQHPSAPLEVPFDEGAYALPIREPDLAHGWDIADPMPDEDPLILYLQPGLLEFTQPPPPFDAMDWDIQEPDPPIDEYRDSLYGDFVGWLPGPVPPTPPPPYFFLSCQTLDDILDRFNDIIFPPSGFMSPLPVYTPSGYIAQAGIVQGPSETCVSTVEGVVAPSVSFAHTVDEGTDLLVVGVTLPDNVALGTMTWNGVPMTTVVDFFPNLANARRVYMFILPNPQAGGGVIFAQPSSDLGYGAFARNYRGVDTDDPIRGAATASAGPFTNSIETIAVTIASSSPSDVVVDAVIANWVTATPTVSAGQIIDCLFTTQTPSVVRCAASHQAGAESVTMSWRARIQNSGAAIAALSLKAAPLNCVAAGNDAVLPTTPTETITPAPAGKAYPWEL